jgi:hypothetical protein
LIEGVPFVGGERQEVLLAKVIEIFLLNGRELRVHEFEYGRFID